MNCYEWLFPRSAQGSSNLIPQTPARGTRNPLYPQDTPYTPGFSSSLPDVPDLARDATPSSCGWREVLSNSYVMAIEGGITLAGGVTTLTPLVLNLLGQGTCASIITGSTPMMVVAGVTLSTAVLFGIGAALICTGANAFESDEEFQMSNSQFSTPMRGSPTTPASPLVKTEAPSQNILLRLASHRYALYVETVFIVPSATFLAQPGLMKLINNGIACSTKTIGVGSTPMIVAAVVAGVGGVGAVVYILTNCLKEARSDSVAVPFTPFTPYTESRPVRTEVYSPLPTNGVRIFQPDFSGSPFH